MSFDVNDPVHTTGSATIASASASITMFGLDISELGVIVSAVIAVATFALHVWYTVRKDRRAREIHKRRLETDDLDGAPE